MGLAGLPQALWRPRQASAAHCPAVVCTASDERGRSRTVSPVLFVDGIDLLLIYMPAFKPSAGYRDSSCGVFDALDTPRAVGAFQRLLRMGQATVKPLRSGR